MDKQAIYCGFCEEAVSTGELLVSALYQAVKLIIEDTIMSWIDDFALDFICRVPIFF